MTSRQPRLLPVLTAGLLAALFASAAPAQSVTELVSAQCATCHGLQGQSTSDEFPQLAGQNAQYMRKQLEDFRSGQRQHIAMNTIAQALTEPHIAQLATYFQAQTPMPHASDDTLLAGMGRYIYERGNIYSQVPACLSCHSATGIGSARLPRLAGQHPQYVMTQLRRFQTKERRNDSGAMAFVTQGLSELELRAVAAYIGGLNPQPVKVNTSKTLSDQKP
jgi:cytochrome c553